jgi:hypothetical protein
MEFADERLFGVEIEFPRVRGLDMYDVNRRLQQAGLDVQEESYNHAHRSTWKLTTDSTCGLELVSPPMSGLEARVEIKLAVDTLRELGAVVNRDCGLHVHHDARDLTTKQFKDTVMLWNANQPIVTEMMPQSRRTNEWCRPNSFRTMKDQIGDSAAHSSPPDRTSRDRYGDRMPRYRHRMSKEEAVNALSSHTRYMALNVEAYPRHGTLEFRQHQGTLNGTKIWNWIIFTQMFITAGMSRKYEPAPSVLPSRRTSTLRSHLRMNGTGEHDDVTEAAFNYMLARRNRYASVSN